MTATSTTPQSRPPPAARRPPKILFVHQSFPAHFKALAPALAADGAEIVALTDAANRQPDIVQTLRYRHDASRDGSPHPLAADFGAQVSRGETVARAALELRAQGFAPDLIVGHFGWGETLFVREAWPAARLLLFAEFYYRASGADAGFDPEFPQEDMALRVSTIARNAGLLAALAAADRALTSTNWQRDQFPDFLRDRIAVVHEGVDTARYRPEPSAFVRLERAGGLELRPGDEVVTFVNRDLEPYRGYHVFMRALPKILRERPKARVVIVGGEGFSYGRPAPSGRSWKDVFFDEVRGRIDTSRVHFVGRVPYAALLALMQVSAAHVYLTYPFILSWSMLEAMSVGTVLIASNTPPVAEVVEHGRNGLLVDFFDHDALAERVVAALADPDAHAGLRVEARRTIVERYDLATVCLPRQRALIAEMLT